MQKARKTLAILASGRGSNAESIIHHLKVIGRLDALAFLASDKISAPALSMAKEHGVPSFHFKADSDGFSELLSHCIKYEVGLVALAGFMRLIPASFLRDFGGNVVNIHPALLPRHGGKGMYGIRVHRAVIDAGDKKSGCTIHWVDEEYDRGAIIAQFSCPVLSGDTAEQVAKRVLALEHEHYPKVIQDLLDT